MKRIGEYIQSNGIYYVLIGLLLIIPHGFSTVYIIKFISFKWYVINIIVLDGLLLLIVYANVSYFIPSFYRKKRYSLFALWTGFFVCLYVVATTLINEFVITEMNMAEERSYWDISFSFFNICRYLVIAFLLYGMQEKQDQKKMMDQIRLEKLTTEVNYLRAQINPHFLFNTLNNLYGLALQKSDKTPEVIIKLSKMMDFMLYEMDGSKVMLERDIENLQNYIEIEKIRQGNNAEISFSITGDVSNQKIEPLLLLPLVENAFKHGVNKFIGGAYLDIELIVADDQISFTVRNNFKEDVSPQKQNPGIGLNNLKRRLALFYNEKHSLVIQTEVPEYQAVLKINLL